MKNYQDHRVGPRVAGLTLLAPIAWGTTYITVTEFLPHDRPLFVVASRVIPAGLILVAAGAISGRVPHTTRNWPQLTMLSLFNFGLFFPLLIAAIYRLPGGVAASFGGTQPLLVAIVGWMLAGTKPRRFDILLGVVAAIGVGMVVIRPGASIDAGGAFAALGANVSFSIGVVLTKKYHAPGNRLTGTGLQLLLSAGIIVPLALLVEGSPPALSASNLAGIAYLSLVATGAAFVIWFNGIRRLRTQAPPVLGLAAPITGAILGWLVRHESLTPIQIGGFGVTIAAIVYAATRGATPLPHYEPVSAPIEAYRVHLKAGLETTMSVEPRIAQVSDEGGDPPCWSHVFDDHRGDIVDRHDIECLVRNFYRDAAMDDLLGPVFEAAHVDWNVHFSTLIDFWAWQLLGEPGYANQPLRAHEPVHARTPLSHQHYERWVELFCDTIDESFSGPTAEVAKGRGRKMAAAMERLLSGVSASGAEPIEPMWRNEGQPEANSAGRGAL